MGHWLTDSTGASVSGYIPKLMDGPAYNDDGVGGMHLYMPWWLDSKKLGFPRGYHIEIGGGKDMPGYGFGGGIHNMPGSMGGGYGAALKKEYRRYYGASVGFAGRGEMVPNENCFCEIDPDTVDKWGIPVLRFVLAQITGLENDSHASATQLLFEHEAVLDDAARTQRRTFGDRAPEIVPAGARGARACGMPGWAA